MKKTMQAVMAMRFGVVWFVLVGLGCEQPCDRLDKWAAQCDNASRMMTEGPSAACSQLVDRYGRNAMMSYADCVEQLGCGDAEGLYGCMNALDASSDLVACARFGAWAAACGLDPSGVEDDCAAYQGIDSTHRFALWVDCVTADGCIHDIDDPRFDHCDAIYLPEALFEWIDACVVIGEYNSRCFSIEPNLAGCLIEAQLYTPSSFAAYADCLDQQACDDIVGQLECQSRKQRPDSSHAREPCERIIAWADGCGIEASVGSDVESCTSALASFTPESVEAYARCVCELPCDEAMTAAACVELLQLSS